MNPPPVSQHGLAVLLQGSGLSEVFILVEAGLRRMENQGIKAEQMARLRRHRDVLAAAHDDRMSHPGHEFAGVVVAESNSHCQDGDDWMSIAEAATELSLTTRHLRRLAPILGGTRIGNSWMVKKAPVLTLKRQRERRRSID